MKTYIYKWRGEEIERFYRGEKKIMVTQAGEDGLVSCLEMSKIYQQNKNACDSGMLVAMQVAAKAQKALDDNRAKKEKRELVNILKDLVDSDDCVLDHHGYCQSHGWLNNSECPHARAKKTLEELK